MQYYANTSAYGPRKAISLVLDLPIDEVELEHDGTGFLIVRPPGANPDPAAVAAQAPPPPEPQPPLMHSDGTPVTDVEKLQQGIRTYREANEAAKEIIFTLMVKVAGALMAFELFTEDNVNAEGARFVAFHREPILDYKTAGRNAVSAQTLYASVASDASKAAFPWLEGGTGPTFLKLFASELGVTP